MNISVTMASGDEDTWEDVADAVDDRGSLVVLSGIEGEEVPDGMKTLTLSRKVDQGMDLPEMEKSETFAVTAVYAPGMWMKVEYS